VSLFRASPTMIALLVASAYFMENLDGSAITIVLPQIAGTFHVTASAASLGVTAYMVSQAIFLVMSAWAADRFGPRNAFCWAIALFSVMSLACAFCPNFTVFVAVRIVQGAAAAFMSPVGRVVVLRTAPKNELIRAFGITIWPGLIAPIIGQPIGGVIATYATWQWIFVLNVPLGIIGIALLLMFIDNQALAQRRPLDITGFMLTAVSLAALLFGLDLLTHAEVNVPAAVLLLVAGVVFGVLAIRRASRHHSPLIDTTLAAIRNFAYTSITGGTFFRVAMGAAPFLLPLLFQLGFGMTAFAASLMMLGYAGGNLIMKSMTTGIIRRFGFRRILVVNGVLVTVSMLTFVFATPVVPIAIIIGFLIFAGLTRSLQFTALNTLAFADIHQESMSNASAMHAMVQQIAFALGIALGSVILSLSSTIRGAPIGIPDFQVAFLFATAAIAVSLPWMLRLTADAGEHLRRA